MKASWQKSKVLLSLISRSTRLANSHDQSTYGYCGSGVGLTDATLDEQILMREQQALAPWGGHIYKTKQGPVCSPLEKELLDHLERELTALGQS